MLKTFFIFSLLFPLAINAKNIAIIGGSAAGGYNAMRDLASVLNTLDSKNQYKSLVGMVNPDPFYNGQDRVLLDHLDNFDEFIIFTGNNEGKNYLHKNHLFKPKKIKEPTVVKNRLLKKIAGYAEKLGIYSNPVPELVFPYPPFRLIQKEPIPPLNVREIAFKNFRSSLENIGTKSLQKQIPITILSLPTNYMWHPWFSFHSTPGDALKDHKELSEIIKRESWKEAILYAKSLTEKYQDVSLFHYYLARMLLQYDDDVDQAFKHLALAKDLDGWMTRPHSQLYKIEEEVAEKFPNLKFVHTAKIFYERQKSNRFNDTEKLFSSLQHLNFHGMLLVAQSYLCELNKENDNCGKSLEGLASKFEITLDHQYGHHINVARWHLGMGRLSSKEEYFYSHARNKLIQLQEILKKDDLYLDCLLAVSAAKLNSEPLFLESKKKLKKYSFSSLRYNCLNKNLSNGNYISSVLREAGMKL